ncbi:hypothetical protein KSP39_PZI000379 [Platanthera zijinensis]|uniref:DUF8040 domain-containing protein n=1 Tax=Platanthera zijinensis TaxID=2320716 RepID=A0AAP0C3K2_9ASPA
MGERSHIYVFTRLLLFVDETELDSVFEYEFEFIIKGAVLTTLVVPVAALQTISKEPAHVASNSALRFVLLQHIYDGPNVNCFSVLRMSQSAFGELCDILRATNLLYESLYVLVKESIALFLYILAHNRKFRDVGITYMRSTDTISRHFGLVLRAILHIDKDYIMLSESRQQSTWRWFENCVGALDGTHIEVTVPTKDKGVGLAPLKVFYVYLSSFE